MTADNIERMIERAAEVSGEKRVDRIRLHSGETINICQKETKRKRRCKNEAG